MNVFPACICLLIATCLSFGSYSYGSLTGHKVVKIVPQNENQVEILHSFLSQTNLDVWKEPSCVQCNVVLRLSPEEYDDVISTVTNYDIHTTTVIEDVQALLDFQKTESYAELTSGFDYSRYHPIDEIHKWVLNVTGVYKDITSLFNVGNSFEGRPLLGLKISTSSSEDKPAFWIHGGIHAREWISPATVIYMVGQMLDNYKKDPELTAMVDMFDWYVLPSFNPDGYAYTWINDDTRLWRKTRSRYPDNKCIGVDPNRNWGVAWAGEAVNNDSCSYQYFGPSPFSEPETRGVARFLSAIKNLKGFIDFHSFGQMWMAPWGHTYDLPEDYKEQDEGARFAVEALTKVYGTEYKHGNHAKVIYVASGVTIDWVYKALGVKYSYIVELRDTYEAGFLLPESQILPTGQETLEGLKTLAKYVHEH